DRRRGGKDRRAREEGGELRMRCALDEPRSFAPSRISLMPKSARRGSTFERGDLRLSIRRADHMGMASPTYYTAEMVRALPEDGNRYETVQGELLVTPAPRADHQYVIRRLLILLDAYLCRYPVGEVFMSSADISWAPDVLVQPDLFVVDVDEARTLDWKRMRTLLLIVEVLSPSTGRGDRFTKRRAYQEHGVSPYWIVDIDARAAEVWTPHATAPVPADRLVWHPVGAPEPLIVPLTEILPPI
ncbi:MAG: Uma2 family endonuclease, partial [Bryobacteraceae bacterium]